ncbi:hypothetical protein [Vitiosangium sp. GDMCC 1.1324]|uniref:hypothetical protein n=1 Tax=Vitiosangium sp. (strain GDMCC 1.1324) TaxID=2138576 RepID=UPI000D39C5CE|nr:hypothetical protein [Vitiosangium sp. GDMCC 1.1324]PTL79635.1 hypothetical protein DAT35_33035 [Vitiosangium sp. GDMCC 1.1324]
MDVRHPHEPGPEFPLLSAFGLEGDVEDGLTDSHRQVFAAGGRGRVVRPEPEPRVRVPEPEPQRPEEPERIQVSPESPRYPVVLRVERFLDFVSGWLEPRVANEELGDALERIHEMAEARAPAWVLYAMAGVSTFWAVTHSVQEAWRRLAR